MMFDSTFIWIVLFFFNDTATTEIYSLSLHDALPIFLGRARVVVGAGAVGARRERGEQEGETGWGDAPGTTDRKSTRLNSSHANISYAVFCLKKTKTNNRVYPFTTKRCLSLFLLADSI